MAFEKYFPVQVLRSDGQGYDNRETGDATPNDDEHMTRWRVTLGAHLKYQLAPVSDQRLYILQNLPDGYELRTAISSSEKTGKQTKHTYLCGHPLGLKHRYRTPGEFVPHVLWLISDSDDRKDCSCTFCTDMVGKAKNSSSASGTPVPAEASAATQTADQGASRATPSSRAGSTPAQPAVQQRPQQRHHQQQAQQQAPAQQPQQPQQVQPVQVQPMQVQPMQVQRNPQQSLQHQLAYQQHPQQMQPQQQHLQQLSQPAASYQALSPQALASMGITSLPNIFRVGELVWYHHQAWRLGIIVSINPKVANVDPTNGEDQFTFTLAPVGHELLRQPLVLKDVDKMRPFLTFSVPEPTKASGFQGLSFTNIDWFALARQKRSDNPDSHVAAKELQLLGLEASKLAAHSINNSFSLFNRFHDLDQSDSGSATNRYGGVFLGAEMIILGDAVRVSAPQSQVPASEDPNDKKPTTVMLVEEIRLEFQHAGTVSAALQFRGTVYLLTRLLERQIDPSIAAEGLQATAFSEEVAFRNSLLDLEDALQRGIWTWKPVEQGAIRDDQHIQGRFYVSHKLQKVIDEPRLQAAIQQRSVPEATTLLNVRHQNGGGATYAGRLPDRWSSLGKCITVDALQLPEGVVEEFGPGAASGLAVNPHGRS